MSQRLTCYMHMCVLCIISCTIQSYVVFLFQGLFGSNMASRQESLQRAPGNNNDVIVIYVHDLWYILKYHSFQYCTCIILLRVHGVQQNPNIWFLPLLPFLSPLVCVSDRNYNFPPLVGWNDLHLLSCIICHVIEGDTQTWCTVVPQES